MPVRNLVAMLPLLVTLAACQGREVAGGELPGTWTLAAEARESLPEPARSAPATLTLAPDGTFQASGIPGEVLYILPPAREGLVDGSGTWRLTRNDGAQAVRLTFEVITRGGEGGVPHGTSLGILASSRDTRLFYFKGDPDEFNRIFFEKR